MKRELEEVKRQLKEKSENDTNQQQGKQIIQSKVNDNSESIFEVIEDIKHEEDGKLIKVEFKKFCILKEINTQNFNSENLRQLIDKYKIVGTLFHHNIHRVYDIFIHNENRPPSILFEYCPTNLEESVKNKKLSKVQQVFTIYQIVEGMKFIHSHKVAHQNLIPSNILISDDGTVKISGFEKCHLMNSDQSINELKSMQMEDVYSFGVIAHFILTEGEDVKNTEETSQESFSLLAKQLIYACLSSKPECRPTFEIIGDVLEKNNFNLFPFSKQEIDKISQMINEYKSQF